MNLKRIIREEINDFDWTKEINPIQCKDLKGYYFYYGTDIDRKFVIEDVFIKNPRGYGRSNDLDNLKIYYTWRDRTTFDWNQMECDTFIHRVKGGDYTLYDKNGVKVDPRDLAYTDGTFDDDERKEIWEQDESDSFDWVRGVPNNLPKDRPWVLVNDVDSESEEVSIAMQKFLFGKQGFKWMSGRNEIYNEPFLAFDLHVGAGIWDGVGYHKNIGEYYRNASSEEKKQEYERRLREFRKKFGNDVYFWSDIGSSQINESDGFDWVRMTPTVRIGGKNDYPIENVPLGTKVVSHKGEIFTIEDITGGHMDFQYVWGSDLETPWIGPKNDDENKNWHNALWLRKFEE